MLSQVLAYIYIGDFMTELRTLSVRYNCDVNAKFNGKEITIKTENDQAKGVSTSLASE